jgi:hypothetical protein
VFLFIENLLFYQFKTFKPAGPVWRSDPRTPFLTILALTKPILSKFQYFNKPFYIIYNVKSQKSHLQVASRKIDVQKK